MSRIMRFEEARVADYGIGSLGEVFEAGDCFGGG